VNGVFVCSTRTRTCSQQPGFGQDLKAVADPEQRATGGGECLHRGHDRREPRDRTGAEVVAVGEPAGEDHGVGSLEAGVLVPHELGLLSEHVFHGVVGVVIAVGSGKDDDGEFHGMSLFRPT
jgi:hypothetical protein